MWGILADRVVPSGDLRTAIVCILDGEREQWEQTLHLAAERVSEGGSLILAFDRWVPRVLVAARKGHRLPWPSAYSRRRTARALKQLGFRVDASYAVWPSVTAPRAVFPLRSGLTTHLRRSGVLGGGGATIWGRILERSPLFEAGVRWLAPGSAMVASPTQVKP